MVTAGHSALLSWKIPGAEVCKCQEISCVMGRQQKICHSSNIIRTNFLWNVGWRSGHLWNASFRNDQLSCREHNNCHMSQFPNGALFFHAFPRHPSCQTPSKRQTSPDTGNPQCSEWHPVFLYYRSLSRSDTEKDTVHLLHRNTEKHYHRNVENFVEDHMEKKNHGPPKFHFNGISLKFYLVRFPIPIST